MAKLMTLGVSVFVLVATLLSLGLAMPNGMWSGGSQGGGWGGQSQAGGRGGFKGGAARPGRQAQGYGGQQGGFGRQGGGLGGQQGGFGGQGGYGIQNWYNTPEGWGYDSTYPGGETHFHSKRGGGGQRGGFGGGRGSY